MTDGILTQQEETLIREFQDRLALAEAGADRKASAELEKASRHRLMLAARLAAIAVDGTDTHLNEMSETLHQSQLHKDKQMNLLFRAWEATVGGSSRTGY